MANGILLQNGTDRILLESGGSNLITREDVLAATKEDATGHVVQQDGTSLINLVLPSVQASIQRTTSVVTTRGLAAEFQCHDDHLESANPVSTDLFTICYWARLKRTFVGGAVQRAVWSLENNAGTAYYVHETTNSRNTIEAHDSTNGGFLFSTTDLAGSGWYFVAETFDWNGGSPATTLYWQSEGAADLNSTTGNNHPQVTVNKMFIGSDSLGGQNETWLGGITRVRIWNAVLTPTELKAERDSATTVRTANLHASYPLIPGASFLLDDSGNGRNLTNPSGVGVWNTLDAPEIFVTSSSATSGAPVLPNITSAITASFDQGSTASAAGVGAATGVGAASAASTAASAGVGAATAVGASTAAATASAAGVGAATGVGQSTASSTAAAAGAGDATAVGASTAAATAASAGTGAATGVGASSAEAAAAAAGVGAASGVGASTAAATAATSGSGDAAAIGLALSVGVGTAAGTSDAVAVGQGGGTTSAAGSAAGTSDAAGVGASLAAGAAAAAGVGAATAVGVAEVQAVGSAAGGGAGAAVGVASVAAAGAAAGVASAAAVATSTALAVGAAAGSTVVDAFGTAELQRVAAAAGSTTVLGVGLMRIWSRFVVDKSRNRARVEESRQKAVCDGPNDAVIGG